VTRLAGGELDRRPDERSGGGDRSPAGERRWAVAAAAAETWRRAAGDWRAQPAAARRRWLQVLLGGWVVCALLAAGLAAAGRRLAEDGMAERDRDQLLAFVEDNPMSFQAAIWFEGWGSSAMLIPVTLVAMVVAARARRSLVALTVAAAYLLHDPLVFLMGWVWPRDRPDLVAGGIAGPPLHSFPSGHTVQVIAVYGFLAWLWARRSGSVVERGLIIVLVAAVTTVVAWARLRLGTHWPSDVWAALPIGLAWLLVCVFALRSAERGAVVGRSGDRRE
jgi:membrane-associated phospholipid phosphatase